MKKLLIIGIGGHANSVIDSIKQNDEYEIIGYVDKEMKETTYGLEYLGNDDDLETIYKKGVKNAFICIGFLGDSDLRNKIYNKLISIGYNIPIIIDKTAILADNCKIGEGTFVGKGSIVNSNANVGKMCIINSGAIVEHDCLIGDFSHIAVSTCLCGGVRVGNNSFIGANSTIIQSIHIGNNVVVGAGMTIISDISDNKRITLNTIKNNG